MQKHARLNMRRGLADNIYDYLKTEILYDRLPRGSRLLETELAAKLGVSRTPLREAIRLLEQEGLVERMTRGGVRVSDVSETDLGEIFGIRAVLESYAGELACARITEDELKRLRSINDLGKAILGLEDQLEELATINTRFHDAIYAASRNGSLQKAAKIYSESVIRFRLMSLRNRAFRQQTWAEHNEIIELLEKRDVEKLPTLLRNHVLASGDAAAKSLRQENAARETDVGSP